MFKSIHHHRVHFCRGVIIISNICCLWPLHRIIHYEPLGRLFVGNELRCLVAKKKQGLIWVQFKRKLMPFQFNLSSSVHNFRRWQVMKVKDSWENSIPTGSPQETPIRLWHFLCEQQETKQFMSSSSFIMATVRYQSSVSSRYRSKEEDKIFMIKLYIAQQ